MRTLVLYNHKGGVAKTVTAVNFAYNLSEAGYRVLVVDMDPQGNASSFFRRYDINKTSIRELLVGEKSPSRCCFRTNYKGIDIIPANFRLREVTPKGLAAGRETLKLGLWAISDRYDYCIVDCPPSIDFLTEVVISAAEEVVIPLKPDRFSTDGLGTVMDVINGFGSDNVIAKGLFTQFYRHRDLLASVRDVMSTSGVSMYDNVIRRCAAVDHSIRVKKPLMKCASRSTAAQDYKDFTLEYLGEFKEVEKDGIA